MPGPVAHRGWTSIVHINHQKGSDMLLGHALALSEARSHLAALADGASTVEASSAYEHVLIELDRIHGDQSPAIEPEPIPTGRDLLAVAASMAIDLLVEHGVDELHVELLLAMLDDAFDLDRN